MWVYHQKTGELELDGRFIARGYAGRDKGKNNPAMQNVKGTGPLPRGDYTIESPRDSKVTGAYVLPLTPDLENEMFGRASFQCHGDSRQNPGTASHGCIIMPRPIRELIWASGDRRLRVEE